MDETKETRQDTSQTGDTSGGDKGSTSDKTEETFTKKQRDEDVRKAKSDALAEVGRYKTSAEKAIRDAQAAKTRIEQMLKDQDDADLENSRDDAEKLTAIRERQARRKAEDELAEVKRERDEKDERIKQFDETEAESTKERNAREIATRLDVDANRLANLAKFTDGSPEAIEEIAKELPKKGEPKEPLKVDSSKTIGGSEDLSSLSQLERAGRELKLAKQMQSKRRTGEDDADYKP